MLNRILKGLKYLWGCMCYSEGVKAWIGLAECGAITPKEYCAIEERLYQKYVGKRCTL